MTTYHAIRWDYSGYDLSAADVSECNSLRHPLYQARAPFYASVQNVNDLKIVATQATMDQEIAFALQANLTGWAFLRYINVSRNDPALALYQSSTARGALKWCSIEQIGTFGGTSTYTSLIGRLITEMQQSYYSKVLSNRPLLYLYYDPTALATYFGTAANLATAISAIRTAAVNAGLGTPYIVLLASSSASDKALVATLGCDASSSYSPPAPTNLNEAYAAMDTRVQAYWAALASGGAKMVPCCMTGWNPKPRMTRPLSFQVPAQLPRVGLGAVTIPATDVEMAAHIQAAKTFAANNTANCDAATVLIYSWNEFGEGHRPVCPTLGNPTGTHLGGLAGVMAN